MSSSPILWNCPIAEPQQAGPLEPERGAGLAIAELMAGCIATTHRVVRSPMLNDADSGKVTVLALEKAAAPLLGQEVNGVIFRNAPVGICYVRNRTLVTCNRRFEELFGYGETELDGRSVRILYPDEESFRSIWDKDRSYFRTHKNGFYLAERPMIHKGGRLIWCIVSGRAIDPENPHSGAIWVLQDISDHKHLEEQLKASVEKLEIMVEERTIELTKRVGELNIEVATRKKAEQLANESECKYRMLFRVLPIGISVTTDDGSILESNQGFKELIGESSQPMSNWHELGTDFLSPDGNIIPKERLPWLDKDYQHDYTKNIEVGMRLKKGGKRRWLSVSSASLSLQNQDLSVATFSDITYRKKIEELERLRHAELTRLARIGSTSEMGAALAHQMGQPLVSALNYLHGCRLRLANVQGVEEINESVGLAITHLEQAGQVLRRVRDFVSKHKPDKTPSNINELIRDAVSFLEFDIRRNNVTLKECLAPAPPLIPLCKIEILQVIFNLLKNGMEAVRDLAETDRIVTIRTHFSEEHRSINVEVQDHGEGLEKGVAKKVFEPYFSTKPNGMGLGLTICRSIIESHEGCLTYLRAGKKGSVFRFTLPLDQGNPGPIPNGCQA